MSRHPTENRPLTDDEIARKFEIPVGSPGFDAMRRVASLPDETVCQVPECVCPHCVEPFTATYSDLGANVPANGKELLCPSCERVIYIYSLEEPGDADPDKPVTAVLGTHPNDRTITTFTFRVVPTGTASIRKYMDKPKYVEVHSTCLDAAIDKLHAMLDGYANIQYGHPMPGASKRISTGVVSNGNLYHYVSPEEAKENA